MPSQPPDESGSFDQISFALLLIRALDKRWTGTLVLRSPDDEEHLLQLDRGLVCRVLVPDEYARLGEIVVEAGVVMENELEVALEAGGLLGEALASANLVDDKTLQRALVLQILKRLVRCFAFSAEYTWRFTPDVDAFSGMPSGVRIDTLRVLWAGLSQHGERGGWLGHTLKRIGESPFMVRGDVNLRRFGFTGDARRLVRVVRDERCKMKELAAREIVPENVLHTIVYLLAITRHLDFSPAGSSTTLAGAQLEDSISDASMYDESTSSEEGSIPPSPKKRTSDAPSGSSGGSSSDAPSGSSSDAPSDFSDDNKAVETPQRHARVAKIKLRRVARVRAAAPDLPGTGEHRSPSSSSRDLPSEGRDLGLESTAPGINLREQLLTEVKSRLSRIELETPFERLGIEPDAFEGKSEDDITEIAWDALDRLSKRWHPDKCPDDTEEVKEGMARIHAGLVEAFETLIDPEARERALRQAETQRKGPPSSDQAVRTVKGKTLRGRKEDDAIAGAPKAKPQVTLVPETMRSNEDASEAGEPPPSGERSAESAARDEESGQHHVTRGVASSTLHERALVAFAEEKFTEALRLARLACQESPDNPDYAATAAWVRANMTAPPLNRLIANLDKVLRDHPDHVTATYYRGVLKDRNEDSDGARADLERVIELDPEHDGAASQLEKLVERSRESG